MLLQIYRCFDESLSLHVPCTLQNVLYTQSNIWLLALAQRYYGFPHHCFKYLIIFKELYSMRYHVIYVHALCYVSFQAKNKINKYSTDLNSEHASFMITVFKNGDIRSKLLFLWKKLFKRII